MIPYDQYRSMAEVLPILCVDIVIVNLSGQYLLVKRANEPRRGQWWVIGGRVFKGETLEQAVVRKVWEESSLKIRNVKPIGYYEDVSQKSPFGLIAPYHAISVVFTAVVDNFMAVKLEDQSAAWKFSMELPADFIIKKFQIS